MPDERGGSNQPAEVLTNDLQTLKDTQWVERGAFSETEDQRRKRIRATFDSELCERSSSSLSLEEYLCCAVEDLTRRPAPAWQSPLFGLVRLLRAHPDLEGSSPQEAFMAIDRIVKSWGKVLVPKLPPQTDPWKKFMGVWRDDAQAEFLSIWDRVRFLPVEEPLTQAALAAEDNPLSLSAEVMRQRSDAYPKFVSLAGWMQVVAGARPILLPVKTVAPLLQVEPMTVSRYRQWAGEDGYLREVRAAQFRGKGKAGRASEFYFDVRRFPVLLEKAAPGTADLFAGDPSAAAKLGAAGQVVAHYLKVVGTTHRPGSRGSAMVRKQIAAGVSVEELMRAAERYAAECDRQECEAKFRSGVGNFYCPEGGIFHAYRDGA